MRRLLPILAGLLLVLAIPTATSGAGATKYTDHVISVSCDGMTATSGGGFVFFSANASDHFGPDGFVDFWATSTPSGQPDLTRDFDQTPTVTWNGTTLAGSIPLVDENGDPAAAATFSATLTPAGDANPFDDRFKDGNHWVRGSGVSQPMDASGTLRIGSSIFSLGFCFGDETTITVFENNPKSFVSSFVDRSVGCELTNGNGDTGFLFTGLDPEGSFVDASASPAGGGHTIQAFGDGQLVNGVLDTTLEAFDTVTGDPVPAGGSIHLVVAAVGEPFDILLRERTGRLRERGVTLDLEGSLTVAGMTFDLGPCIGVDGKGKRIETAPSGPKPGGKGPPNDRPSGATTLKVGARASISTKGASPDREADYPCMQFEEDGGIFEAPVGFTVWYKVVGTGGSLTVDTAGSDYDTVAAVYTSSGSGFTPVPDACVDDVPTVPVGRTLQAAVTWATTAGTTYYVQIGGFPSQFPYGNLRVAVR
jgi:hypothetical protein